MTKPTLREVFTQNLLMDFDGTKDAYASICQFVFPFAFEDLLDKPIDQITKADCQRKYREIRQQGDGYVFAGTRKMAACSLALLEEILESGFSGRPVKHTNHLNEIRQNTTHRQSISRVYTESVGQRNSKR